MRHKLPTRKGDEEAPHIITGMCHLPLTDFDDSSLVLADEVDQ